MNYYNTIGYMTGEKKKNGKDTDFCPIMFPQPSGT